MDTMQVCKESPERISRRYQCGGQETKSSSTWSPTSERGMEAPEALEPTLSARALGLFQVTQHRVTRPLRSTSREPPSLSPSPHKAEYIITCIVRGLVILIVIG